MKRINLILSFCLLVISIVSAPKLFGPRFAVHSKNSGEFRVAVVLCLSGSCANWGHAALKGLQLASQEINRSGGILGHRVKLDVEDTREDQPSQAVLALNRQLSRGKPDLIIGPTWSPAALAMAPILKREGVVTITPSVGIKDFNEYSENLFNMWPHDEISSRALAKLAIKSGLKRAAIFGADQPWTTEQSKAFEDEFKKLGGEIVSQVHPLPTNLDLAAEAYQIVEARPELVVFTCFEQLGVAAKKLRELGYRGAQYSILMDQDKFKSAARALEGTITAKYPAPNSDFIAKYRSAYGEEPQKISADSAYDALYLYVKTANSIGTSTSNKMIRALRAITSYHGASGNLVFDGKGGVVSEPEFYQVGEERSR